MEKKRLGPYKVPKPKRNKHFYIDLPEGGHASFPALPSQEILGALNEMVRLAKKNCK